MVTEKLSISECIALVDTPKGRTMFKAFLQSEPFPHFEAFQGDRSLLVRIEADGTRRIGTFVDRNFVDIDPSSRESTSSAMHE